MLSLTTRRQFLGRSLSATAGVAIGGALPGPWLHALADTPTTRDRILIVIQLSGGNDGLNTVVPFADERYRGARPKLAIATEDLLKIDNECGLHPSLDGAARLLESGRLSIIHGVGYQSPNRSHFESMDIWHTCRRKEERSGGGWLGRLIESSSLTADRGDSLGLHLGNEQQPLALAARGVQVPSIASIEQFRLKVVDEGLLAAPQVQDAGEFADSNELIGFLQSNAESALSSSDRLSKALQQSDASGDFPATPLGEKLQVISRLIVAGLGTKIYYVTLDGFDTHAQQPLAHAALLRQWSDALEALVNRLEQTGHADRVLTMTFSEFGRRVEENASQGTDHGAAAPVFFAGPSLPQAIVGKQPSLTELEDGDLKYHTDFRSVYATLVEKWFGAPSQAVLGAEYKPLELL